MSHNRNRRNRPPARVHHVQPSSTERLSELQSALVYAACASPGDWDVMRDKASATMRSIQSAHPLNDATRRYICGRVLAAIVVDYWRNFDNDTDDDSALRQELAEINRGIRNGWDKLLAEAS